MYVTLQFHGYGFSFICSQCFCLHFLIAHYHLNQVFDSAHARERERELLYPDACGGGGRGWISQGMAGYGRGHGTRETCALHSAQLSVDTLVDFWSALGEESRQSLLRMKEEDFIERLMYRCGNCFLFLLIFPVYPCLSYLPSVSSESS